MEGQFFVYGTLLQEDVWQRLIGRVPEIKAAKLRGFRRYQVLFAHYPAMWFSEKEEVSGGMVGGLTPEESHVIDDYEGAEYHKQWVTITAEGTQHRVQAYIRQPQSPKEWNTRYHLDIQE